MRTITPHKGNRSERFEARMTTEDKTLLHSIAQEHGATAADVLAAAVNALNDEFSVIEQYALIHGIERWAYDDLEEHGRTVVVFGDGTRIETIIPKGKGDGVYISEKFEPADIDEFFGGVLWDARMHEIPEDVSLLEQSQ